MRVAILGAGPAGMMAAHACARNGLEVDIFSADRQPSQINADMFLQRPLPGVHEDLMIPDDKVEYVQVGDSLGYASKCYGDPLAPVSWDTIEWGSGSLWWLRPAYDALWQAYGPHVHARLVGPVEAAAITTAYPVVLSTVPAPSICGDSRHTFGAIPTWLVRDGREYDPREGNVMVYNGDEQPSWFRHSRLRGVRTWEYALDPQIAFPNEISDDPVVLMGKKFTGNTCDCHPTIHRIGRWAQWQRGVLNHHAFEQATAILASVGLGKGA